MTKNYPDDAQSDLDGPDRWRLNIHVGTEAFLELTGEDPRSDGKTRDYAAADVVLPHPVYRGQGWVSIVNPGPSTRGLVIRLLGQAHEDAQRRAARRGAAARPASEAEQAGDR